MDNSSLIASTLTATTALAGFNKRFGATYVSEVDTLCIVAISVPESAREALNAQLNSLWQLTLPQSGACVRASDAAFAGTVATLALFGLRTDQYLLVAVSCDKAEHDAFAYVQKRIGEIAYLADQSDSYAVLDVTGPGMISAMEKLCTLDLALFSRSQVARTLMEHLSVIVEAPGKSHVRLYSPRSSASDFLHAVTTSLT